MKHSATHLAAVFCLIVLTLCSCKEKRNTQFDNEAEINPRVEEIDNTPDEALLVRLVKSDRDSITVSIEDTHKELTYSIAEASMMNKIKGSLKKGNLYSIFPESNTQRVKIIINVDELLGRWFYDTKEHRGMTFEKLGGMSSINAKDICFRQWKLLNGELYLYYLDLEMVAPDRHEFLVEEAEILSLSKDNLRIRFLDKVYDCRRQTEVIMFDSNN